MNKTCLPAVGLTLLIFLTFNSGSALGQRQRRGRAEQPKCAAPGQSADFRVPELATPNFEKFFDLGDGFEASAGCGSVIVTIPGAYSDSLSGSRARPLSLQLAAAVFVKANNTSDTTPEEAIENSFITAEQVRRAGDMVTVYLFRVKGGRVARIFTYYNDLLGLTGVLEMSAATAKGKK